ncbi:hypothetical protein BZA05DRAFT_415538 [Tricharina praecox]|uniref:uncharacterized protein n=1 Tax=Tricharina praecox TaxID=43433 RepID=UPI00221E84A3|nr:uncharacterized protein BZA05DRAFT_415538 [Tricharina praecox]KAI5856812.1 hypothetical protein BZA05DRAFT_415538 [Tricharina praecox]
MSAPIALTASLPRPAVKAKAHKLYNLILPISLSTGLVLLGYKKRGFGIGKYNGFGGKVEAGETLAGSAARELHEESGIVCSEEQLAHHAVLLLETVAEGKEAEMEMVKEKVLEIHVFVCTQWEGEVEETDEMRPQWFAPEDLPLDDMWEETRIWMLTALGMYLSVPASAAAATANSSSCGAGPGAFNPPPPTTTMTTTHPDRKWFIHYVDFHGGVNAQTGEWDPWHGMGKSVWKWFDTPLVDWSREEVVAWVEGVRNGGEGKAEQVEA